MSTGQELALLCAPAGCGFDQASTGLRDLLQAQAATEVLFEDVEDVLCKGAGARAALKGKIPAQQKITMREVTWYLTRNQVMDLWRAALSEALARLDVPDVGGTRLLACHLNLYGGKRREFYSPPVFPELAQHSVSHVLLFVDDIYDMYMRLSTEGHIYDEGDGIAKYLQRIWDDEGHTEQQAEPVEENFSPELERDLRLEWKTRTLSSLLAWRHSEMMVAESLANQLGANYVVFGTKQLAEAAALWVQEPRPQSVYLSHPISRPRRKWRSSGSWPPVVAEFNELQALLLDRGIVAIMPTAIDEYRLTIRPRTADQEISARLPILEERWPLPAADTHAILYQPPGEDGDFQHADLLMPSEYADDDRWNIWLRALESQVMAEIPFRDHHLVVCNRSILAYRPCYEAGVQSSGVKAELAHWAQLRTQDPNRRAAFLHLESDAARVFERQLSKGSWPNLVQDRLLHILTTEEQLAAEPARRVTSAILSDSPSEALLDAGEHLGALRSQKEDLKRRAAIEALGVELTIPGLGDSAVGLWIFADFGQLKESIPEIAAFLKREVDNPQDWQDTCLEVLQRNGSLPK